MFRPYGSNRGWFVANYESFKIEKKSTYNYNVTFNDVFIELLNLNYINQSKNNLIVR